MQHVLSIASGQVVRFFFFGGESHVEKNTQENNYAKNSRRTVPMNEKYLTIFTELATNRFGKAVRRRIS